MKFPRLAVRALNDYRRLSPLSYLGLRYSLTAAATLDERWAEQIAPEILRRQGGPAYLRALQYKQVGHGGKLEYRNVRFPGANEALAEAALLAACSAAGGPFAPTDDVFSYHLARRASADGSFERYFKLFMARQRAIARACRLLPKGIVLYADIRSFYPSVTTNRALKAWHAACEAAGLGRGWREVGDDLLEGQRACRQGLLIGPMFSHVVGNVLLSGLDEAMRRQFPRRHFRYVDDFVIVIPPDAQASSIRFLREELGKLELHLNPDKVFTVSAQRWLATAPYQALEYDEEDKTDDRSWMRFIDALKCYLIAHSDRYGELVRAFLEEDIRVSLPRYREAVADPRYGHRFRRRLASPGFKSTIAGLTVRRLVNDAQLLRRGYEQECEVCLKQFQNSTGLERKWSQSRLRYLLGRLMVLATQDRLALLARLLEGVPEFAEYHACFRALVTRDASELVQFSGKVCAAAGQAMAASRRPVRCKPKRWSAAAIEGYVTLRLLGLDVSDVLPQRVEKDNRTRFALGDFGSEAWLATQSGFFQELFALATASGLQRHRELLQAPSDPDERWVVFADELYGPSS